jgi:hypothetical protein
MAPDPIPAFNQWSCCLASISWVLSRLGSPKSQEDIIYHLGLHFPTWTHRAGLMERGDILNLLLLLGIPVRKFYHLNDKEETLRLLNKFYPDYIAGFVLTRKPTNHCLAINVWDGDTVTVMDSAPQSPAFRKLRWDDVFQQHDADVFFLFK